MVFIHHLFLPVLDAREVVKELSPGKKEGCGGGLCAIGQRCVSWEILSATALWGWWGWNEKPRSQTLGRHQIVICAPSVSLDIHIEEGGMTWFMWVCQLLQNYLAM
jgi:hypothetical protein